MKLYKKKMGPIEMCEALKGVKPVMVMVVVQIAYAGMNIFYKLAANDGMNLRVLVAYRMMFATVFIAPLALIFERNNRPKLTWVILFQAFLCGLFGGLLAQNLYIESLYLTSASFASAVTNLIPAVTFVLAVSFRMEEVGIGSMSGNAKVLGTLMGIGGAMLLTFYKGQQIVIWSTHVDLMHQNSHQMTSDSPPPTKSHVLGSFLAICCCFSYAIWLIIQGKMSRRYPCHYSSTALMSLMGSIQCVIFALCMNTQTKDWNLNLNIRLYTAAYSGIVTSGVAVALIAWCVVRRGPLFISIFNPLSPLLVTVAGSLVLDENMHLGSMLGAVLIVCGLYMVLWGKNKEMKKKTQILPSKSSQGSELVEIVNDTHLKSNVDITDDEEASSLKNEQEIRELKV